MASNSIADTVRVSAGFFFTPSMRGPTAFLFGLNAFCTIRATFMLDRMDPPPPPPPLRRMGSIRSILALSDMADVNE